MVGLGSQILILRHAVVGFQSTESCVVVYMACLVSQFHLEPEFIIKSLCFKLISSGCNNILGTLFSWTQIANSYILRLPQLTYTGLQPKAVTSD